MTQRDRPCHVNGPSALLPFLVPTEVTSTHCHHNSYLQGRAAEASSQIKRPISVMKPGRDQERIFCLCNLAKHNDRQSW